MRKTYKIFNGEHRTCFFRIGKTLIEALFNPTYTTDDELVQKAIEDTNSFKVGAILLTTPSMEWIKIDRDENGFATEECLGEIFNNLPVVLRHTKMGGGYDVLNPKNERLKQWFRDNLKSNQTYTHYLPLPND